MSTTTASPDLSDGSGRAAANLVVLVGTLSSAPRLRDLPSGTTLASIEVTTAATPRESVPVSVFDPPATVANLDEGDSIVLVGRVRRRFYRAGGTTQSRTEVVAERVARTRASRSVGRVVAIADERLADLTASLDRDGGA